MEIPNKRHNALDEAQEHYLDSRMNSWRGDYSPVKQDVLRFFQNTEKDTFEDAWKHFVELNYDDPRILKVGKEMKSQLKQSFRPLGAH